MASSSKSRSKHKLEPISLDELAQDSSMTGFTSVFRIPTTEPPLAHLKPPAGYGEAGVANAPVVADAPVLDTPPVSDTPGVVKVPQSRQNAKRFQSLEGGRLEPARAACDAHTQAEEAIYQALWQGAAPGVLFRDVTIGTRQLMAAVRLSERAVQLNLKTLQWKLAIEVTDPGDAVRSKTYRVHAPERILARRKAAGLEWIQRKRGGGVRLVAQSG